MTPLNRAIRKLDLYKTYEPETRQDWREIISAANALLKAAGVK